MEFRGSGPKFPFLVGEAGGIAVSRGEERIADSIKIIIGTAKGERVMRPEFGCDLHSMVFSVINTSTLTVVRTSVREALDRWEPRIDVLDVSASTDDAGVLQISVDYRVRRTNTEHNLVYPFYLRAGGER